MRLDRQFRFAAALILSLEMSSCDGDHPLGPNDVASIALHPTRLWLAVGDTAFFGTTTVNPAGDVIFDKYVSWRIDNPSIANVLPTPYGGGGVAVAIALGTATITATSEGKSASATLITVPFRLGRVEFSPAASVVIGLGKKFSITTRLFDIHGDPFPATVQWRIDNPSIATVDDQGRVNALAVGGSYFGFGWDEPFVAPLWLQVVQQSPIGAAAQLAAGYRTACTVNTAGAAFCWGDGTQGQLANGDPTMNPPVSLGMLSVIPLPIPGRITFSQIAPSASHTCGLSTDGAAYCWGRNDAGELGEGHTEPQKVRPVAVSGGHKFITIASGSGYTCALDTGGAAWCWGENSAYNSSGTFVNLEMVPVVLSGGLTFSSLSAGSHHACGITTSGQTYCWGPNTSGELGDGSNIDRKTPTLVAGGIAFVQVSAGNRGTCALTASGTAYCWGENSHGQLGDGTTTSHATPTPVGGSLSFTSISLGDDHACAVQSSGAAYCWGDNTYGELGNGTTVSSLDPVEVSSASTISSVRAGLSFSCGVSTSKVVYCWGKNDFGAVGDGSAAHRNVPTKVEGQQ
jgi:alpha-tubulin suppressor-like RCC1 family protein